MAQIILFGGGDGGGLIISARGVRPIPPFDPSLLLQLRGLSALLNGAVRMPEKSSHEMGKLLNKISNLLVDHLEAVVGRLEGEHALVYQDEDGGFSCGSTGKPPIPIPWPPRQSPSIGDLIANGVLESDLVAFVNQAGAHDVGITEILENPAAVAARLGMKLSERTVQDLRQLAPCRLQTVSDPVEREIIHFFHKVAEDRRFLSTWATRPAEAAEALKIKLSDRAFERVLAGGRSAIFDPGVAMNPVAVAVAVGIVIMLVDRSAELGRMPITDRSGVAKF